MKALGFNSLTVHNPFKIHWFQIINLHLYMAGTRAPQWRDGRVFFCTPQTVQNDLLSGDCPADKVVCLVVDEAHRAKGDYAYTKLVRILSERGVAFRLLALTATPGWGGAG